MTDSKPQAAYIPGRGTTEHVMAMKLLIEKAINASDYELLIRLPDMPKAFDIINHSKLMQGRRKHLKLGGGSCFY